MIIETKYILLGFIASLGFLLYSIKGFKKNTKDEDIIGIFGYSTNIVIFYIPTFGLGMWLFSRFLDSLGIGIFFILALILLLICKSKKN